MWDWSDPTSDLSPAQLQSPRQEAEAAFTHLRKELGKTLNPGP
jgi:hypothetical protein